MVVLDEKRALSCYVALSSLSCQALCALDENCDFNHRARLYGCQILCEINFPAQQPDLTPIWLHGKGAYVIVGSKSAKGALSY